MIGNPEMIHMSEKSPYTANLCPLCVWLELAGFREDFGESIGELVEAERIDWSGPRLLCIAGDFTRYDEYAVLQIPRNFELLRYRRYGGDLLLLELVRASTTA